jgi:heme/copper-type cytochrome/quinol oxidase subunit 3
MFELEEAIAKWREQMAAAGLKRTNVLDELETHLRDDIEQRTRAPLPEAEAFVAATRALGDAATLQSEFEKAPAARKRQSRIRHAVLVLAGANPQMEVNDMNAPKNSNAREPGWATYVKGAVFLIPAVSLWAVSAVFLFPKVQQLCRDARLPDSGGEDLELISAIMQRSYHLLEYGLWIAVAVVAALIVLEWRSKRWPRYRRAAVGTTVFLLNSAVLLLITVTLTIALLAAPALSYAR